MDETNRGWVVDQGEVDSRHWVTERHGATEYPECGDPPYAGPVLEGPVPDGPLPVDLFDEAEPPQWQERALCAQTDPEAFFPEKGGSTREAKRICSGCEVRSECLEYALVHDERFGIWGGLSERERRRLKRRAV